MNYCKTFILVDMKKVLLSLMILMGTDAMAYDYPYLAFQTSDGTVKTVGVESLTLSISNGYLVVKNSEGSQQFSLSDLSAMYFSTSATGIRQVETEQTSVKVFSMSGVLVGTFDSVEQARASLKKGVYVVVADGKNYKMNVK